MSESLRIVFAGTPEFAAEHLKALLDTPHQIIAVYSQPDRPAGRGQKLTPSPVKQLALQHDIPVYQPQTLRDPAAGGAGDTAPGLHQQSRLATATLAWCCADSTRGRSR